MVIYFVCFLVFVFCVVDLFFVGYYWKKGGKKGGYWKIYDDYSIKGGYKGSYWYLYDSKFDYNFFEYKFGKGIGYVGKDDYGKFGKYEFYYFDGKDDFYVGLLKGYGGDKYGNGDDGYNGKGGNGGLDGYNEGNGKGSNGGKYDKNGGNGNGMNGNGYNDNGGNGYNDYDNYFGELM